jgi:Bacteriophage related domain of unknown function
MTTQVIQALLDAAVEAITSLPAFQPESTNFVKSNAGWVRGTLLPARSTPLTIGIGAMKTLSGIYQVDCYAPIGSGTALGRGMQDSVVAAFPMGLQLVNGATTVNIRMASAMGTLDGGPGFANFPVQIEYAVYQ